MSTGSLRWVPFDAPRNLGTGTWTGHVDKCTLILNAEETGLMKLRENEDKYTPSG
jgi:hypothetical protein